MPLEQGHVVDDGVNHHVRVATRDGGACLTGHDGSYVGRSCSYRWQAHDFSKGDADRIAIHDTPVAGFIGKGKIDSSAFPTSSGGIFPAYYAVKINRPTVATQWHLAGPAAPYLAFGGTTVAVGKNFQHCAHPYWHNSHHLIPKGTFGAYIASMSSSKGKALQLDLFNAGYNINFCVNVLILPMDTEVAALFELPRHLILADGSAYTVLQKEFMNHSEYNDKVRGDLKKIFNQWQANKADLTCTDPARRQDLVHDLHVLSQACLDGIVAFGKTDGGEPISAIPWEDVFA